MKYILTEKEYRKLKDEPQRVFDSCQEAINQLCTVVADNMILHDNWINNDLQQGEPANAWGCIHSTKDEWYCDDCPVQQHCTQDKHWSK